jgi:hypothetical protein
MELSEEQVDKRLTQLARKMGEKNASSLLSVLGKNKQFLSALETPVGQELLKDAVSSVEGKIELILAEKDKPNDRAELQAYLAIIRKWQGYINRYNKDTETFNKNVV